MLQQILNDMYIDPELLAELDEEQKQILFCKMREEQVRRWKLREDNLEEEDKKIVQPKKSGVKKVRFLVGVDGDPVVVVLGGDSQHLDTILQDRARRQAELEADLLKRAAEEELDKLVRLSRSTVQAMEEEATRNASHDKSPDPAREAVVKSLQEATVEMEQQIKALEDAETKELKTPPIVASCPNTVSPPPLPVISLSNPTSLSAGSPLTVSTSLANSNANKYTLSSSTSSSSLSSLSSNSSVSLPPSPPAFSISSYGSNVNFSLRKTNGMPTWEVTPKTHSSSSVSSSAPLVKPPILSPKPTLTRAPSHPVNSQVSPPSPMAVLSVDRSPNNLDTTAPPSPPSSLSSTSSTLSSLSPSPPPLSSPSSPTTPSLPTSFEEKVGSEICSSPSLSDTVGVAAQIKRFEQLSEGSLEALKTATLERAKKRRQKEILEHLRSQVEAARQQAAEVSSKQSAEKEDSAWQEQERKAKEAERRIREIARRAREEHRRASNQTPPAHAINRNLNGLTHGTLVRNNMNGNSNQSVVNGHTGIGGHPSVSGPLGVNSHSTSNGHSTINGHSTFISHSGINGLCGSGGDINGNIKHATEDFSNNNNNNSSSKVDFNSSSSSKGGRVVGCVRQRLRPPKPPSRAAIVAWFREEELPRGAGLEPSRTRVAPWFHGIISRIEAEEVLAGAEIGCFLVRVSERIWGYAISYRAADRCRHYLIDVTGGKYTFFGSHQASHDTLGDLIEYHTREAITATGGELLTRPCGQSNPKRPDHLELFTGTQYLAIS